jgi:hypothetical protein
LANGARRRLGLEIVSKDGVELLDLLHVEQVELQEHHVRVRATGFLQQGTQVAQGLVCLVIESGQHLARLR